MQLLLSIALPLILIYLIYKKTNTSKTLAPPGPRGLPFIGNLHQFAASNKHIILWKTSIIYGPFMLMKLGFLPLFVVSSAKAAKEVMKTQDISFCDRPKLLGQRKLSYNASAMSFLPYCDYWRELRKITAVHFFSVRKTQSFRPIREEEVSRMISNIRRIPHSSSSGLRVVNLSEMAMALGSSLIFRIAFGKRYDDLGEIRRFQKLSREAQGVVANFYVSDCLPLIGWVVDKLNGSIHHLNRVFRDLDSFYQVLIDEHLDPRREKKTEEEEDILDILIKLKENKSVSSVDLGWDQVKALLLDVFVGAADSSGVAVLWTMVALMKAPDAMTKVQEEIRNLVRERGKVDEDDVPKLPYLKAVVREALRLYPPAPLIPRVATQACTIEGYQIQPNSLVVVNAWAVARDHEYWENAEEFKPERFLNSNTDVTGQDFGALPFGSGRRICPGISMGLANVELAVANLLYSFDWEMPPGIRAQDIDTEVVHGLTMQKKNPLMLVATDYIV